jgi:hypothetical protein
MPADVIIRPFSPKSRLRARWSQAWPASVDQQLLDLVRRRREGFPPDCDGTNVSFRIRSVGSGARIPKHDADDTLGAAILAEIERSNMGFKVISMSSSSRPTHCCRSKGFVMLGSYHNFSVSKESRPPTRHTSD